MYKSQPHFYICGGGFEDKVMLYASSNLRDVEFEAERDEYDEYDEYYTDLLTYRPPTYKYTLTAESYDVTKIIANDYKRAFEMLFGQWSPEKSGNLGIEGMRGI